MARNTPGTTPCLINICIIKFLFTKTFNFRGKNLWEAEEITSLALLVWEWISYCHGSFTINSPQRVDENHVFFYKSTKNYCYSTQETYGYKKCLFRNTCGFVIHPHGKIRTGCFRRLLLNYYQIASLYENPRVYWGAFLILFVIKTMIRFILRQDILKKYHCTKPWVRAI